MLTELFFEAICDALNSKDWCLRTYHAQTKPPGHVLGYVKDNICVLCVSRCVYIFEQYIGAKILNRSHLIKTIVDQGQIEIRREYRSFERKQRAVIIVNRSVLTCTSCSKLLSGFRKLTEEQKFAITTIIESLAGRCNNG